MTVPPTPQPFGDSEVIEIRIDPHRSRVDRASDGQPDLDLCSWDGAGSVTS
jgi:hypothetical protein